MAKGKIISVYGGKGGCGRTTIAVNLASELSHQTGSEVLLIDANMPYCRDIELYLNTKIDKSLAGIVDTLDKMNNELLTGSVTNTEAGIPILPLSRDIGSFEKMTSSQIKKGMRVFAGIFKYIVVDAGNSYYPQIPYILDNVNLILVPMNPDVISIVSSKGSLDFLQQRSFAKEMIWVVENKGERKTGLDKSTIESSLNRRISISIPNDPLPIESSMHKGVPVFKISTRSQFVKSIGQLTAEVLDYLTRASDEVRIRKEQTVPIRPSLDTKKSSSTTDFTSKDDLNKHEEVIVEIKKKVHEDLIGEIHFRDLDFTKNTKELRDQVRPVVSRLVDKYGEEISSRAEREQLVEEILDEALGLGPIEPFVRDSTITEIMVNRYDQIYIERKGKLELTKKKFLSDDQLLETIRRIVTPLGRRIDELVPMQDARLQDGSRVNAIIPPLAIQGPSLTIRKFSKVPYKVADLINFGTCIYTIAEFLRICVLLRQNILVSGGTGTGKTTLLNVLSSFIPEGERIITIEDSAELQLSQPHTIRLEARPASIEGKNAITIRDLVKNALRMRPDRIVVGECRGGEALDMLQAMNTGHDGSLTTVHANSTEDSLSRLETLVMMAGVELPSKAIREQITSAIDIVVQLQRFPDGSRKIVKVTEIAEMKETTFITNDIFKFDLKETLKDGTIIGNFLATSYIPKCFEGIEKRNIPYDKNIFKLGQ